ncbi:MAG: hypothetical protein R3F41_14515 [Gammaproteobacteria bacterium]|nr:hypothetical protein [Pseudomonadales bacterium]MCP5347191.1 hypothetical protein [Pseudomonadales bacterium]
MKKIASPLILAGLMMFSVSSHALVSWCAAGPDYDGFYHRASLDTLEMSFPYVRTWIETHVNGPVTPSLNSMFYNTRNSWHFFINMPPGSYTWSGYSHSEVGDPEYFWEIMDFGLCASALTVVPPPFCESTDVQLESSSTLTSDIHGYLVTAIKGGFEAVERLGVCSMSSTPTFSGSLNLETVSQCCEAAERHDSATRATGSATFSVPLMTCSVKQIIVPAYGIVIEGAVGAGANATLAYAGMNGALCDAQSSPITLSGTVSGGFGGEIGVGGISTQIIGAGVSLSDSFSLTASGPDVLSLEVSGCIGPAEVTGWVRFAGAEFRTEIVPREWAEGTTLCF